MNFIRLSKSVTLTVLLALSVLASLTCSNEGALTNAEASSSGVSSPTVESVKVRVSPVSTRDVEKRIVLSGEVYATDRVNVLPKIGGLLSRVLVKPGDTVAYNQVIAYVDPSRPGASFMESPVRSKVSGTVTIIHAVAGNQVSVQSVIAEVGNLNHLEIEIRVPEKHLAFLRKGMTGWIRSRAFADEEIFSRVVEVSPVVDPQSRTILVKLVPDNNEHLRPGQAVSVDLVLEVHPDAVMVPATAVTERSSGIGVFIIQDKTVVWRPVVTGIRTGGYIEVIEGLTTNESVVVAGLDEITDGSRVAVIEE